MALRHKGMREFSGEELSSVSLGQNGFMVITNQTITCGDGGTSGYENIEYFVALKAVNDDVQVEARSITDGMDLTLNSGGVAEFSSPLTLVNGDIIYGAFDKIEVASGDYLLAYIGRSRQKTT